MKDKLLSQAKIALLTRGAIFFSTILFNCKITWDDSIPTACTNGINIRINPDQFVNTLNPNQRVWQLAHETVHIALGHLYRRGERDSQIWQLAADHVDNLILKQAGYEIPPGRLHDDRFRGMSTEQVYDVLCTENIPKSIDYDIIEIDNSDLTQVEEILIKAITASKLANESIGSILGESERILNELVNPVLPWNVLLQNYMDSFIKEDYSYRKPNRRYTDIIMPSLYSEGIDSIIFAVDCSGSVSEEDFNKGIVEFNSIKEKLNPTQTYLLTFDTEIKNTYVFQRDELLEDLEFIGWGGTDLQPVFDYANEINPTVLVVFSDLYCEKINEETDYPVIWICFNNPTATVNFGELIHYDST